MIVFAYCGIEKSFAVLHNFPNEFKGNVCMKMLRAFFRLESSFDGERIQDLRLTLAVLRRSSKSLWSASFIFPSGVRQDLCILYAFCRVTDDMMDDILLSREQKEEKLSLIRNFLNHLFGNRTLKAEWKYSLNIDFQSPQIPPVMDWSYYASSALNNFNLDPDRRRGGGEMTELCFFIIQFICLVKSWLLSVRLVEWHPNFQRSHSMSSVKATNGTFSERSWNLKIN